MSRATISEPMPWPATALVPNRRTTLFNTKSGETRYKKADGEQVVVKVAHQSVIWLLTGRNGALC
jgi:hypothetical protein